MSTRRPHKPLSPVQFFESSPSGNPAARLLFVRQLPSPSVIYLTDDYNAPVTRGYPKKQNNKPGDETILRFSHKMSHSLIRHQIAGIVS